MDQDGSGANFPHHSSKMEQVTDDEILIAATVMENNVKRGEGTTMATERNLRENNENMGEESIRGSQLKDPDLKLIIENGILLQDEGRAGEIVLGSLLYQLLNGILYYVEPDKSLCLIPPDHD